MKKYFKLLTVKMNLSKIAFSPCSSCAFFYHIPSGTEKWLQLQMWTVSVVVANKFGLYHVLVCVCFLPGIWWKDCEDSLNLTNYEIFSSLKEREEKERWLEILIPTCPVTNLPFINKQKTCQKKCRERPGRQDRKVMMLSMEFSLQAFIYR